MTNNLSQALRKTFLIFGTTLLMCAALPICSGASAVLAPLHMGFGNAGLTSLRCGSNELLADGAFSVRQVILTRPDGSPIAPDRERGTLTVDAAHHCVTRAYTWGVVNCTYRPAPGRLALDITITNRSENLLSGLLLQALSLRLPGGAHFEDEVRAGCNVDSPTVVGVTYGSGTLAVANEDVTRPLYLGLPAGDPNDRNAAFPLLAATYRDAVFPRPWLGSPPIARTVYPGESDHLHLTLRVGPAGQTPDDLAGDVFRRYAMAYPSHLSWPDRRPIGYLNLCTTVPHPENGRNPRGWFNNDPTVDVTTPEGCQHLQQRLLDLADTSIPLLKATNAQGVIIWDIEGQEYPHAMSYVGDPRHLPPEVEPVADQFFQKFRDAGLRVGVCLRPQKPLKTIYGDVAEQVQVTDTLYNLEDKIAYAKKRWGCTLFYVDSNVHFNLGSNPSDPDAYQLLPAEIFQAAAVANPDVLIIPEQQTTRYYAYGAPYDELRQGVAETPDAVRRVYPGAFTIISVATDTGGGPLDTRRADLISAVRRGDILLFRTWYHTPEMTPVQDIYQAAGR